MIHKLKDNFFDIINYCNQKLTSKRKELAGLKVHSTGKNYLHSINLKTKELMHWVLPNDEDKNIPVKESETILYSSKDCLISLHSKDNCIDITNKDVKLTIKDGKMNFNGDVEITGSLKVDGIDFKSHKHQYQEAQNIGPCPTCKTSSPVTVTPNQTKGAE